MQGICRQQPIAHRPIQSRAENAHTAVDGDLSDSAQMLRFGEIEDVPPIELAGQAMAKSRKHMAGMVSRLSDSDRIRVSETKITFQQVFHADPVLAGFLFAGFNMVGTGYLGATEKAGWAFFTSIVRGVLAISVCAYVLAGLLGMTGIWLAFPAAELLTAALMIAAVRKSD